MGGGGGGGGGGVTERGIDIDAGRPCGSIRCLLTMSLCFFPVFVSVLVFVCMHARLLNVRMHVRTRVCVCVCVCVCRVWMLERAGQSWMQ